MRHAPGPWEVEISPDFAGYRLKAKSCGMNEGTVEANARLIAAAPELLEAAQKALDFIHTLPYESSIAQSTKAQDALEDAIMKARGQS